MMLVFLLSAARVLSAETAGKIVFRDSFETTMVLGETNYTNPELFFSDKAPGGEIRGPFELVEGKEGNALRFKGLSNIRWPMDISIELDAGELSFWVKLDFDPEEDTPRRKNELSNQLFLTVWAGGPELTRVMFYNAGGNLYAFGLQKNAGTWVFNNNFSQKWEKDQWRFIQVKWGEELELWCDGVKKVSGEVPGLFGVLPVNPKEVSISFGSHIGWTGVESEFTIDEFVIRAPE